MAAKKSCMHFLFLFLISLTLSSSSFSSAEYESVYDLLQAYGLPKGIVPDGVTKNDFTFDPTSGKLRIHLSFLEGNKVCTFTKTQNVFTIIPVYNRVELQPTISATVKYQRLDDIKGITATVKLWNIIGVSDVEIVKIQVSEDAKTLRFLSSIPTVQSPELPTDAFAVPQTCDADLTVVVSPINMMPFYGGIVEIGNKDDDINNPLFFYKGAFPRRV